MRPLAATAGNGGMFRILIPLLLLPAALTAHAQDPCDVPPPPAGVDTLLTTAELVYTPPGMPPILLPLEGPTIIERSDEGPGGLIETEIVSMELTGIVPGGGTAAVRVPLRPGLQCPPQATVGGLLPLTGGGGTHFPQFGFFA